MDVADALRHGAAVLRVAGIEGAGLEARLLLGHAMGVDQAALLRDRGAAVPDSYAGLLARRAGREPLAFIVGRQGFWTMEFEVSGDTLIPRADSEALVEAVLAARPDRASVGRVLDLGTGTGCLLLSVLSEYPRAWGVGTDLVAGVAALAARNARANGLQDRAAFVTGDWGDGLAGHFDVVLSNPPYIRGGDIPGLMPEVMRFEPWRALDGGEDGLLAYWAVMACLPGLLSSDGVAVLELGAGQAEAVGAMAVAAGFRVGLRADLAGVWRAMVLDREGGR